ncbi:MAG: DUF427 domain-containing protein [Pseudomonadota bacterium]
MPQAIWRDALLADSDDTVVVEGNHYFPRASLDDALFEPSTKTTECGWKGTAQYLTVVVDGERNDDAAFYYADPKPAAAQIAGRVAFWRGVTVR